MTLPRVSVITATYNRSEVLRYAIESVLRQTLSDFEMLVIGDGCTDDSAEVVHSFRDARLRWHNLPENSGHQSGPNNAGLEMARGEFVAYLGHDDIWAPDHLNRLVSALEESKADIAYSWTELIFPPPSPLRIISGLNPSGEFECDLGVPPSSLLHRRAVFTEIGGWKDYRTLSEEPEVEFLRRALEAGKKFVCSKNLSVFKFNSAFRPNSYIEKSSHEQARYMQRLKEEPDFQMRELAAIIHSQIIRHPEDVPRAHDWKNEPPGTAVKRLRILRGLDSVEERSPETSPTAEGRIHFDSPAAEGFLSRGWAAAEKGFRWNDGQEAVVVFRLAAVTALRIRMRVNAFLGGGKLARQIVRLSLNDTHVGEVELPSEAAADIEMEAPVECVRAQNRLDLSFPEATSPAALGLSADWRRLAIAVRWLEFESVAQIQEMNKPTGP